MIRRRRSPSPTGVAVLERGEIRQEGAMRRVWSRPGRDSGVHAGSLAL